MEIRAVAVRILAVVSNGTANVYDKNIRYECTCSTILIVKAQYSHSMHAENHQILRVHRVQHPKFTIG